MLNLLWGLVRPFILPRVGASLYGWFATRTEVSPEDAQIIADGFIAALEADTE